MFAPSFFNLMLKRKNTITKQPVTLFEIKIFSRNQRHLAPMSLSYCVQNIPSFKPLVDEEMATVTFTTRND